MVDATIAIHAKLGSSWTDITSDVLSKWSFRRGIAGNGPKDRVASPGILDFQLNNSVMNSGGLLGYYSPDHANLRANFEASLSVRAKFTYSGNDYYKFLGKITDITPAPGRYRSRRVDVSVSDYMEDMARHKLNTLAVQANKRDDQLLTTVIGNMPIAPLATDYATGPDTYSYGLHDVKDESTTALAASQKIAKSGMGYIFVKGDQTGGETLTYQSRHTRLSGLSSIVTLNDSMVDLVVDHTVDNVFNQIKAQIHPADVDASATTALFTLQTEVTIHPGETVTLNCRYRDPSGAATRISGIDMVDPLVADTNYKFSSISGNSGNDLNGSVSITPTFGGNTAVVTVTNNAAVTGYLNKLSLQGKGVYLYDPLDITAEDSVSQNKHNVRPLNLDMPYQDSYNVGYDAAYAFLNKYKDPFTNVVGVKFIANTNDTLMTAALSGEIGNLITLTETVTGLSSVQFFINHIKFTVIGKLIYCEWGLERASSAQYWILGDTNFSQLGTTTVLGW